MISRFVPSGWTGRFLTLLVLAMVLGACSPREQGRAKRWKAQADAYFQGQPAPLESNWPIKVSEEEDETVVRKPVTFPQLVESLPHPQSWPRLQSSMVLRFLKAQGQGEWRAEIQNRLLHLFFIYLNDSDRYTAKRWNKAYERLNNRLDAIEANLPKDSADLVMIEQIRSEMKAADLEVEKRFGQLDGLGEVKAFEEQLKVMEPMDRNDIAARVGGQSELEKMEKISDETISAINGLIGKYLRKNPKDRNPEAFKKEMEVLAKRQESYRNEHAQVMSDPVVRQYFEESRGDQIGNVGGSYASINVPDLVTLVGAEKAEVLLKRVLNLPVILHVGIGVETQDLARTLALRNIDRLKAPQWGLAESLDGVALFEALEKRFPDGGKGQNTSPKNNAEIYYLFGLVAQNRSDDALAVVGKMVSTPSKNPQGEYLWYGTYAPLRKMQAAGYGEQVWNFMAKLLERYPNIPLWQQFITLSAKLDKNEAMLALVESFSKKGGINEKNRGITQRALAKAYLSTDRIEEGVVVLKSLLKPVTGEPLGMKESYQAGIELAELGQLLQRSDWIAEGLAAAEGAIANQKSEDLSYSEVKSLVTLYEKLGRNSDAERVIKGQFERWKTAKESQKNSGSPERANRVALIEPKDGHQFLEALLSLYVNQDRNGEALELLTQSPEWGKADLADYLKDSTGYPEYPTGYWASWALGRLGKNEESLTVARGQIRVTPGSDGAYAILTQFRGKNAIPFLDKIYQIDQFEERPLIWKAKILTDMGELDEAEKVAQAAIAVDPSDGEEGKGDRMRVYAVLAEIEKKKGDKEKVQFFENVIRAIRLSEDADDFSRLGLNTRAIAMYREALGFFNDAYCIQSRLALQLMKAKKEAEALEHYQKAYELMPGSFGRVESHCFGCEKAFDGKPAQSMAEKVFTEMLKKQPGKPQVHYLMGYLREEQGRYPEALEYYRQAVALDPFYLNAWKHIEGLKERLRLDPRLLDQVQLKLLALDPSGQHSEPDLKSVNDLPRLWGHMVLADRVLNMVPVPEAVFELTASSEALRTEEGTRGGFYNSNRDEKTFARILLQHPAVGSIKRALDASRTRAAGSVDFDSSEMIEY